MKYKKTRLGTCPTIPMQIDLDNEHTLYITDVKISQFEFPSIEGFVKPTSYSNIKNPIDKVIFNNPAVIVFWKDGMKTVVKCGPGDVFDAEKGLAMAIAKKYLGNKGNYYSILKKYLKEVINERNDYM